MKIFNYAHYCSLVIELCKTFANGIVRVCKAQAF